MTAVDKRAQGATAGGTPRCSLRWTLVNPLIEASSDVRLHSSSQYDGHVGHINAAMPAVPPGYMEQCLSLHVPPTVDLVLLEASANMCGRARREGAMSGHQCSQTNPTISFK